MEANNTLPGIKEALACATAQGATKNQAITMLLKELIDGGIPVAVAIDAVLGEGTHAKIAGDIWQALRK